jgi:AcrR family transcriptional regulator
MKAQILSLCAKLPHELKISPKNTDMTESSTLPPDDQKFAANQTARRKRRAAEILKAARDLFLEFGYEKTAVSAIAKRIGVAEGLVYSYYSTKRDLLHHVLTEFYEPLIREVEEGCARLSDMRSRIRFIVWRHLRTYLEAPNVVKIVLHELRTGPDYETTGLRQLQSRYTQSLVNTVKQGMANGELADDVNPEMIRAILYGGTEHLMWRVLHGRESVDLEALTDRFVSLMFHGLLKENAPRQDQADAKQVCAKLDQISSALMDIQHQLKNCPPAPASPGKSN